MDNTNVSQGNFEIFEPMLSNMTQTIHYEKNIEKKRGGGGGGGGRGKAKLSPFIQTLILLML